jgi:hypothetical protein
MKPSFSDAFPEFAAQQTQFLPEASVVFQIGFALSS